MIASQICTEGYHQKMNACTDMHEAPPELADALARIDQAKENYISLAREMDEFLYNYVKGMVKGLDRKTGNFVLQLRPSGQNTRTPSGSAVCTSTITTRGIIQARRICCCSQPAISYLSPSARCAPVNGLAGFYVSTIREAA